MTRITTTVLVALILLNGMSAVWVVSGLAEDTGVTFTSGIDDKIDALITEMKEGFSPNINIIESFVSLSIAALRVFDIIISTVFLAPVLVMNLIPGDSALESVFVGMIMAPMYLISTLELVFLATGNDMV